MPDRLKVRFQIQAGHGGLMHNNMRGARYRPNCLPGPRESFKRGTVDLAPEAIEGAGGVFRQ